MTVAPQIGDLVIATFPRMRGKARPGLVAHIAWRGDGERRRLAAVVATPATSRRNGVGERLPLGADEPAGGWLLPAMTAALPPNLVAHRIGPAPDATVQALLAALERRFGRGWRITSPALEAGLTRPRLLHRAKRI